MRGGQFKDSGYSLLWCLEADLSLNMFKRLNLHQYDWIDSDNVAEISLKMTLIKRCTRRLKSTTELLSTDFIHIH